MPTGIEIQLWQPLNLSQSTLSLRLDPIGWEYLLLIVTCLLGFLLTRNTRPPANGPPISATIFYVGITSIAVMAANVLTALLAWALMDLTSYALWFFQKHESSGRQPQSRAGMILSAASLLFLLLVAIVEWVAGGDSNFLTPAATPTVLILLAVALTIRSFAFYVPVFEPRNDVHLRVISFFYLGLPIVSGCAFLARQLKVEFSIDWAFGFSVIGILASTIITLSFAFGLSWRKWLSLASLSWIFLAVGITGNSTGIAAGGLLILIISFTLNSSEMFSKFHRAMMGFVLMLAIGTPFTLGGVLGSLLTSGMTSTVTPVAIVSGLLGVFLSVLISTQILITLRMHIATWPINERALRGAYLIGFGLPILIAIGLGFRLYSFFSVASLGYAILSLAIVCLIYFIIQPRMPSSGMLARLRTIKLNFAGLGKGLGSLATGLLSAVRSIGELLEGENAILWMLFVLLMLVLLVLG
jgi:hypothetical protein